MGGLSSLRLHRSRFLRAHERDGLVVATHQLHPEPIFFARSAWSKIEHALDGRRSSLKLSEVLQELIARKLIVPNEETDQRELVIARRDAKRRLQRPTIIYLMMAQGCNWKCAGCPIHELAHRYGERLLTHDDACAGLSLWQRHIDAYPKDDDPYFIIFYGGEPLLNRPTLERLLPFIQHECLAGRLPKKLELMLCTNGQLIDEEISKLLASYSVTVAVGMDGLAETNDATRKTRDGSATFESIELAVRTLIKCGVRVVVSTTITPANVSELSQLGYQLRAMGVSGLGFNLLKGGSLKGLSLEEVASYAKTAARVVLSGINQQGMAGSFYEYQLEKKLDSLRTGSTFSVDCTCYGNQLVIQADGQVGNCPFDRHDLGHVQELSTDFRLGHSTVVQEWQMRLPIFHKTIEMGQAQDWLDGGGCAWGSMELHGDESAKDSCNATFVQEVQRELIWTLLPTDRAIALRRGEVSHWAYRGLRPLHDPMAGDSTSG